MTFTQPVPAATLDYVVQCAACLGTNPTQPTEQLAQWAEFAGPCLCEVTEQADPRMVGGRYYCAYWQETYTVLAMWSDLYRTTWLAVQWEHNGPTVHCTAWDGKRDRIIEQGA